MSACEESRCEPFVVRLCACGVWFGRVGLSSGVIHMPLGTSAQHETNKLPQGAQAEQDDASTAVHLAELFWS